MVEGSDPGWNTALVAPGFAVGAGTGCGLHAWEVVVTELDARPHLCIGVAREGTILGDIFGGGRHDLTEKMAEFGGDAKGWGKGVPDDDCPSRCGWGMMGNGCLWWAGCDSRVDYGEQLQHGDVVGVQLDLDVQQA